MPEALDFPAPAGSRSREKNAAENAVSAYEVKIESVGTMLDTAHQILDDFQEAFLDNKEDRRKINTELRDILAHNEHLRKKDFDNMTQGVLSAQEEREAEVKNLLKGYLNQQREMARTLRDDLAKFKDALAKSDVQRVKEFQEMIKDVLANQDARKEEVAFKLKEFQKEQQEMAKRLKALLAKGRSLRIKDLKEMLQEFRTQHKERLAQQIERGKEVNKMLGRIKDKTPVAIYPVRNIGDTSKENKISNGVNIDIKRDNCGEKEVEKFNKIAKRRR